MEAYTIQSHGFGVPQLNAASGVAQCANSKSLEARLSAARILLVEDEYLIRLFLSETLVEAGYDVTEAETADEGYALVEVADQFDMLVTDIQTPGHLDGVELARHFRCRRPGQPIVFMTGRPDAMASIGEFGPREAFIRKPYGPREVLVTVNRLLDSPAA